jgi:hypothetical protein
MIAMKNLCPFLFAPLRLCVRFFHRLCVLSLLVASALVFVVGCPSPKEALIPVSGMVTVRKQPLSSGTVVFHPDPTEGNIDKREPRATIAGEFPGLYKLTTDNQAGAPLGWYKVTVHALKPVTSSERPPEWLADQKYADEKTSGHSVQVVKDPAASAFDFDLDPPK